jgi:uncharacterized protein (TIGR00661 family)
LIWPLYFAASADDEMTNILYGVHGIGHGHAIRALTLARFFPQHNFLFISDNNGYELLYPEYKVLKVPGGGSPAFQHTMPYSGVVDAYFRDLFSNKKDRIKDLQVVESFQPDLAITDYESNLPRICRMIGLPCLSIDHQHIARFGSLKVPFAKTIDFILLRIAIWLQFREIKNHMIISFFDTPIKTKNRAKVFPPILRQNVIDRIPSDGEHVLAYFGYPTTNEFHKFLLSLPHPVRCYGMKENKVIGNVTYKINSPDHFLDDLASCRYVVSTAGHTLLSEALFYGKPIMAFPIRNACEQFLNSYYLEKNGYGLINDAFTPSQKIVDIFEKKFDYYKTNIRETSFCGNETVIATLHQYFNTREYIV